MGSILDVGKKKHHRKRHYRNNSKHYIGFSDLFGPHRMKFVKNRTQAVVALIIIIAIIVSLFISGQYTAAILLLSIMVITAIIVFRLHIWFIKSVLRLLWKLIRLPFTIRNRQFQDNADTVIRKALKNVDSLNRHYRDEEEANKELYTSLKAFAGHMRIEYEPRHNGNNIGDIRIGNIVIEGKLDLVSKTETDRLVGQIQYCCSHTPFKMRIVIYGQIRPEAKARIKSSPYFPKRVSLIYLSNPQRKRREYKSDF
jgi:hypothetical protein